jgi:hypothetical protein
VVHVNATGSEIKAEDATIAVGKSMYQFCNEKRLVYGVMKKRTKTLTTLSMAITHNT